MIREQEYLEMSTVERDFLFRAAKLQTDIGKPIFLYDLQSDVFGSQGMYFADIFDMIAVRLHKHGWLYRIFEFNSETRISLPLEVVGFIQNRKDILDENAPPFDEWLDCYPSAKERLKGWVYS